MDSYVKNFIIASVVYLGISSLFGILMMASPAHLTLKFVHSHLMLLGWVTMMIYGVGYHVLPRFAGRVIKSRKAAEVQFWLANIGLIGMVVCYTISPYSAIFGLMEAASIMLFVYNMLATLVPKPEHTA
ncbi:cbb3-type cytochrome c oxidase subunit I [Candidatus Magnetominusculus dajiuhuensis]|uniref:cbb3-type cytochrome c oxidase subunit I n=1 Tax=Candidatus Magnetominusculus dajiuhuensis TaxID=3137712 RepID=UPI001A05C843|nr:cbb3-type cytochrome c oxidase subunit I [Nitrospirota bacterium]